MAKPLLRRIVGDPSNRSIPKKRRAGSAPGAANVCPDRASLTGILFVLLTASPGVPCPRRWAAEAA